MNFIIKVCYLDWVTIKKDLNCVELQRLHFKCEINLYRLTL